MTFLAGDSPVISVKDLCKSYGRQSVLEKVSFDVFRGECFCLLGPNGAGKTTALRSITGLLPVDSGSVSVLGTDPLTAPGRLKGQINIIPQQPVLDPLLTVEENLIFRSLLSRMKRQDIRTKIAGIMTLFELNRAKDRLTYHCSGGEVQRLLIACALIEDKEILFMDEPTSGIDIVFKNTLWDMFREKKKNGTTILLNTHDLNEAEVLSDRIAFIFNGRIAASGTARELKASAFGIRVEIVVATPFDNNNGMSKSLPADTVLQIKDDHNLVLISDRLDAGLFNYLGKLSSKCRIAALDIKEPTLNDVFRKFGRQHDRNTLA